MKDAERLALLAWPYSRLGEALGLLARVGGLSDGQNEIPTPELVEAADNETLNRYLEAAAAGMGVEAEAVAVAYAEIETLVQRGAPALLRLPDGSARFWVLVQGGRRTVTLLDPNHKREQVAVSQLCHLIRSPLEATLLGEVEQLLDQTGLKRAQRARAKRAILNERLSMRPVDGCWLLRIAPGASLWDQGREAELWPRLIAFCSAHTFQYLLWLLSWAMIGRGALQGRLDPGWLLGWALLLVSLLPLRILVIWLQGQISIRAGALLKRRLLAGAL